MLLATWNVNPLRMPRRRRLHGARSRRGGWAGTGPLARDELDLADSCAGDMDVTRADIGVHDPAASIRSAHATPDERGRRERILEAGLRPRAAARGA